MSRGSNIQANIFAVIFALMFLLFLNSEIGSVLLYVAVGVGVITFVLLCVSRNHFTAKLQGLSGTAECGRRVEFEVVLEKKGFCFIPFAEVCVDAEESIRLRTSLLFRKTVTVKGCFEPKHSGLNKVVLEKVIIGDFLGNGKFNVRIADENKLAVYPQVVQYDGPEVFPNMLPSEEEEAEEGVAARQGGMPGYEHREYVPGDSPRRVNYKLSAKKGKLMVRLDESNGYAATNLLIAENGLPSCCDKAFALASQLVIRGGTVKITHRGDERIASTPETLDRMREWLAFREFARELVPAPLPTGEESRVVFAGDGQVFVQN